METNKLILACLITLCSLPVAAQVKLGIEAGANLSNYITDSHSNPFGQKKVQTSASGDSVTHSRLSGLLENLLSCRPDIRGVKRNAIN